MRVFQSSYRDRAGNRRKTRTWYVEIRDVRGDVRRITGFRDKRATLEMGRKLARLVPLRISGEQPEASIVRWLEGLPAKTRQHLARLGLLDPRAVASSKPLREHLADYEQSLRDSSTTDEYVTKTVNRVTAILDGTGTTFLSDLSAASVSRYLADRRAKGLSAKSSNHYLAAVKGFANWLVRERRASENPLGHLSAVNAETDRKHVRRPLEPDELRKLLTATRGGPERHGMTGENRYWLYRIAAETGLRSNELRSLRRASIELDGSEPAIALDASAAKNRTAAVLPLRRDTASELREFLAGKMPAVQVFKMPRPENVVVMLRGDLKAAGISYRDDAGRVADFHALRVTFASLLLRAGVDVRTAKDLMRHSTIAMTADVYACTMRGSQADAVERLPDLSKLPQERARATGTDNADPDLALCLARKSAEPCNSVRDEARHASDTTDPQPIVDTMTYGDSECVKAHCGAGRDTAEKPPPRGLEPLSPG